MENNEREFILDLEKISRKHKIKIDGCGCCGSPMLDDLSEEDLDGQAGYGSDGFSDVCWISPNNKDVDWNQKKDTIIKE